MFLKPTEAVNRFGSNRNIAGKLVDEICREARGLKITNKNGREFGASEVPNILKPVIGAVALADKSCRDTAEAFDISKTSANEYSQGNYGTKISEVLKKQVVDTIDAELSPIRKLAMNRITKTMENISDGKLEDNSAKTLSEIARNLSSVIKNSTPQKQDKDDGAKYNFNIFAPRVRDMAMYDALELGAEVEEVA